MPFKAALKEAITEIARIPRLFQHHEKVLSLNVNEVIRENHESSLAVFAGFFGTPSGEDRDLMTCYKNIDSSLSSTKYARASDLITRMGWRISVHSTASEGSMKVAMVPGPKLSEYLTRRSMGLSLQNGKDLYRDICL